MNKKNRSVLSKPNYTTWLVIVIVIAGLGFLYSRWQSKISPDTINMTDQQITATSPIPLSAKLEGKWERTDGGYVLALKGPLGNGDITAKYFNPNPINVGRSMWQLDRGKLKLMVELQDKNYPGSVYSLEYVEHDDVLKGTYFQAMEKMTYEVEFKKAME